MSADLIPSELESCGAARKPEIEALDYGMRWAMTRSRDLEGMTAAQLACAAAYNCGRGCDAAFVRKLTRIIALRIG